MGAFASWLMGFAKSFLAWGYNDIIDLLNGAISGLCAFIGALVALFPSASGNSLVLPTAPGGAVFAMVITTLNWLFPMQYLLTVISFLTIGMVAYFGIAPVLRWFKVLT